MQRTHDNALRDRSATRENPREENPKADPMWGLQSLLFVGSEPLRNRRPPLAVT